MHDSAGIVARARFEAALDALVADIRADRHILAAILCGSLSHDEVWDKSDIDLVLVSTDDKKTPGHHLALVVDDINIHTEIIPRAEFRRTVDRATRNTFPHSLFAKARLLYSTDPSIETLFEELHDIGAADTQVQLMRSAMQAVGALYKAHKWLLVRNDPNYAALWILYTARSIAEIELGLAGRIVARDTIPDAQDLNPELFDAIYVNMLNRKKTRKAVTDALSTLDAYLERKTKRLFAPLLDYLAGCGEPRSGTDIQHHFERHFGIPEAVIGCEWLADLGVIDKVSTPARLTRRSQVEVEELGFFYGTWSR